MSSDIEIPFDRVTWRSGQRLDARDLRDDHRRDGRLRQLHVRHLHDTWGIALGFEVTASSTLDGFGRAGSAEIVVGPGYAVDGQGRDLLLAESIQPSLPAVDGRFVLTVAYREDSEFPDSSGLPAPGIDNGLDLRQERVRFAWRTPEEVRFGPEVPLSQITIANGAMTGGLDFTVRRYTQPLLRPHIDMRVTEEGRSGWKDWLGGPPEVRQELGLELEVDTSEAGFTGTPFYFAVVQGDFANRPEGPPLFEPNLWPQGEATFSVDSMGFISTATAKKFIYRILNVGRYPFLRKVTPAEAESRRWRVAWLGLEPVGGCEPTLDVSRIFTLSGFRSAALTGFTSPRVERGHHG
jgi:hypothetical protein